MRMQLNSPIRNKIILSRYEERKKGIPKGVDGDHFIIYNKLTFLTFHASCYYEMSIRCYHRCINA